MGKLISMEGQLSIKRHAHEPLPAQARWCRVSTTIPTDGLGVIKAGLVLGYQAERAEATGEPEAVVSSLDMYIQAKRLILPRLQDVEPEQQVELSQKLALWSRCITHLKAERPGFVERANAIYTGSCLAVFESAEDRSAPAVSAVLPQDSTSPTGRRGPKMALTRGEPVDSWPIRQVELSSTFVRTQPGCFRQLELINAETGARVRVGTETKEGYALWLAAFQKDCKGRLDHETQQADFSIAGVTDPAGDAPDYTSLNARTADHTWLAHPRRGSLSLELEASTPKPRERRLSTDEEYLQELKDTFNPAGPDRQRARTQGPIRTQSISGSVSNSPPAAVHSDDTIVMDFGSHSLKAGRARDEFPVHIVRSLHPETGEPLVGELSGQELGESWKVDWDGVESLWHRLFDKQMRIDPACHDFIVTEPPDATVNGKRELAERLLEDFGVPRLVMRHQAEMGLLSHGRTTGLAVSCGDRLGIIPYVEGYVLREYSFEADFGGRDVTREWQRVASERYPLHDDRYVLILRKWKEAHSFCRARETAGDDGKVVPPPVVGGFAASLETGLQVEFRDEAWRACEALFTAPLFRSFDVVGLQGAIHHVINQCPIDQRARLYSGIELMGGTTRFDGLVERLEAELCAKIEAEGNVARVRISAKRNRQYAPWMGGAGLAELAANGGHDLGWLTLEEVEEEGYDRLLGSDESDEEEER